MFWKKVRLRKEGGVWVRGEIELLFWEGRKVDLTVHHDPDNTTFLFAVSWLMEDGVDCEY